MIRDFRNEDIDTIIDIWYEASVKAHNFVSSKFWANAKEDMKNIYIPKAETFIIENKKRIMGFYSLYADTLAAIFIDPNFQRNSYGTNLIEHAFSRRHKLNLKVYAENNSAICFYKKHGFQIMKEGKCPHTGAKELTMYWSKR